MFNYYACRKIAAEELSKGLNELSECQKQKKLKGKQQYEVALFDGVCYVCA